MMNKYKFNKTFKSMNEGQTNTITQDQNDQGITQNSPHNIGKAKNKHNNDVGIYIDQLFGG